MTIATIDRSAESVVAVLEQSRNAVAQAVTMTTGEIATEKAKVVMAETYSRELRLSREIQQDAQELVRRFEYELGKSIRQGQEEGTIGTKQQMASYAGRLSAAQRLGQTQSLDRLPKPSDFASESELMGARGDGIYALADGVTQEQFSQALDEAKAEGNVSRANVVRKVKQQTGPTTRQQRADLIADLAAQGYSSRQMPSKVGVTEESVRQIARDFDIEISADRAVGRSRRINSAQVVENTATALEGLVMGVELIDYSAVDRATASQWADSLSESMRALNRFVRLIKEQTHD